MVLKTALVVLGQRLHYDYPVAASFFGAVERRIG
jgi:hypothetical protein